MLPEIWSAWHWLWPTVILISLVGLIALITYVRSAATPFRWLMLLLRLCALLLLALCLLEPQSRQTRPQPGANLFLVIADDSQSLQIQDRGASVSRAEQLAASLKQPDGWKQRLAQDFEVRCFTSADRLRPTSDFENYAADQRGSRLVSNLELGLNLSSGKPIAGVIWLTDGNATDVSDDWREDRLGDPNRSVRTNGSEANRGKMGSVLATAGATSGGSDVAIPVYPIVIGSDQPPQDLAITSLSSTQTNFETAPVTITANLISYGLGDQKVFVELRDGAGVKLDQQEIAQVQEGRPFAVRFKTRPTVSGVSAYQVLARMGPDAPQEATLVNNQQQVIVDRGGGPFRILYVSGRPNWDLKFLRRALSEDSEIDLVALVRIAKREAKFTFRGREGQDSNALFRGFKNENDDTAERFDEPVFLRLGTRDSEELRGGFPSQAPELFSYDAVVLDDVEADFFTAAQKALLQNFVSYRGGGLLMLGGQESFTAGNYDRSPIGEMLPVYLDQVRLPPAQNFRLKLTREGWLQAWVRLASTEDSEARRLEKMPSFVTLNAARSIKPGASVLSSVIGQEGQEFPALVIQSFGRGRTAALLLGDLWKWHLKTPLDNNDLMQSWRQTMRWLVTDVPGRLEVSTSIDPQDSQRVHLQIDVRDSSFRPMENAELEIAIEKPDGQTVNVSAQVSESKSGRYEADFSFSDPGVYTARVTATSPDQSETLKRDAAWVAQPDADEFAALLPNRKLLESVARSSGGEVRSLAELEALVSDLPNRKVPIMIEETFPWWHRWTLFAAVLGLLIAEWGLRRWKGLP